MDEADDETAQAAKDTLAAAIREYHHVVNPGVYVDAWALITHKRSAELEQDGQSAVSHLVPTGQAWPLTVGMLRIASRAAESEADYDDD